MSSSLKVAADAKPGEGFVLRGDNRRLLSAKEHEVVLSGPSDTGKSVSCCVKLHLLALRYPGAQLAMVRKVAASLAGSVIVTFTRTVRGTKGAPKVLGGSTPNRFVYDNGSVIWTGGMDRPEKVLSSERDAIYVCQAEQLELNDWEMLSRTCSGRGAVIRTPQLFADCNPGGSKHWIRQREKDGKLRLLRSTHRDNPTLFDDAGVLLDTADARQRIRTLEDLTGVRRKRLYEGLWVTAEGAVYDNFDSTPGRHVVVRPYAEMVRMFLTVDVGFTNPAVVLEVGEDSDGRWHVFREFHERNVLPEALVAKVIEWWSQQRDDAAVFGPPRSRVACELCAVDAAAAGPIASLQAQGVNAVSGKGKRDDGIWAIKDRLTFQGDGRPRLTLDPSCVETINEFESYIFKPGTDVPIKEFDHSLDALRYLHDVVTDGTGGWDASTVKGTSVGQNVVSHAPAPRIFVPRRLG